MYVAEYNNEQFLITLPNYDDVVVLIVTPTRLEIGDGRCLKVMQSIDTVTGEVDYSVMFPEIGDNEHDLWAGAMQCAAVFMMNVVDEDSEDDTE